MAKIRELCPDLIISTLVNKLLFHYVLLMMDTNTDDSLHPTLLRKVAENTHHDEV